jgi:hypothetical protein
MNTDYWFEVDWWENPDDRVAVWPYIALGKPCHTREPVTVFGLPDPTWNVYRSPADDRLFLGRSGSALLQDRLSRRARWYDENAQFGELGEIDLAHANQLRLIWNRRSIGLRTIQLDDGPVRLVSDVWHGDGSDRYLPIFNMAWTLPPQLKGEQFLGGPGDGMRWFGLRGTQFTPHIHAEIVGHMSESAEVTDIPAIAFAYEATVYGLVLQPKPIGAQQLADAVGAALHGRWSTGDDPRFCPALTAAVDHAIRCRMPDLHYFARVAGFHLQGEAEEIGSAIVWFLEPTSGGQTASRAMAGLLQHKRECRMFFELARGFLEALKSGEGTSLRSILRRATQTGDGWGEGNGVELAVRLIGSLPSGNDNRSVRD